MRKLIFLTFCSLSLTGFGQRLLVPNDPEAFSDFFSKEVKKTKNPFLENQWLRCDSLLNQALPENTKQSFRELSQKMAARGHSLVEFQQLFLLLTSYVGSPDFDQEKLDKLLFILQPAAVEYPVVPFARVLSQCRLFLTEKKLYQGNINTLYVFSENWTWNYTEKPISVFEPEKSALVLTPPVQEDIGFGDIWNEDVSTEEEEDPWDNPSLALNSDNYSGNAINLPKVKHLLLEVNKATLALSSPSDSIVISETTGTFDLFSDVYVGSGGYTSFQNQGIPEAIVTLDKFSFRTSIPKILAENTSLEYPEFLKSPIKGILELRAENRERNRLSSFPRFKSYKNNAEILGLPSIKYVGGFSMVGDKKLSTSVFDNISTLEVNPGTKNSFKAIGRRFELTDTLITSKQVIFSSALGEDSIYHPAVRMLYKPLEKELKLYKLNKGGFRDAMYSNTFHEMDIKCDAMQWNLNGGQMNFYIIAGKSEIPAVFESFNYYNPERLRTLSTAAGWNPLIFVGNYLFRKNVNRFDLFELNGKLQKDPNQIRNGIIIGTEMGFFEYDPYTDSYKLSRKGIHYYKAVTGRGDYDDLVLASSGSGSQNASINRENNALDIAGTQEFKLSDSLGIRFLPKDQKMMMEGSNRFKFAGEIRVKNYRFFGDFDVDYENFKVNLLRIDSIKFTPIELYKKGSKLELGGYIQFAKTGTLYLNDPKNKSGRKKLDAYPKLEIPEGAIAYFDHPDRRFKYHERVQFRIPKISQDSLNAVDMAYTGQFYSNGIMKPITEVLTTMADTSIGFSHRPKGAYELYGNGSKLSTTGTIDMTSNGLKINGTLKHLAASLEITEGFLYDSSMVAKGENAQIKETSTPAYFPEVNIASFQSYWKPFEDSLTINSAEDLEFYSGTSRLKGSLLVRKMGLFGSGELDRDDSRTLSNSFKFDKPGFIATQSTFTIKNTVEGARPVLEGDNVNLNFNVQTSLASIKPMDLGFNDTLVSEISFPNAAYKTTITEATWDLKNKTVTMQGDVETSRFTALATNQQGLSFKGNTAFYNIPENTLKIGGIPGINTVDAVVIPKGGEVFVKSGGKIEPLEDAVVIADSLNKYHVLTKARVNILSKFNYEGSGMYQFVNVSADTFNIQMSNFSFSELDAQGNPLDLKNSSKLSTIARANIKAEDSLYLSPKIIYRGEMTMLAPFKNLNLKGSVRPILEKYPFLGGNWINYSGNKSEAIQIAVDENLKDGGKPLFAGLHIQKTTTNDALYPTFLSAKRYEYDHNLFLVRGTMVRDEENKRFVIEPLNTGTEPINRYELYDADGLIKTIGNTQFVEAELSKNISSVAVGTVVLDSLDYYFQTMLKYNLPMPIPLVQKIANSIVKSNLDVGLSEGAILFQDESFRTNLANFIGKKEAENMAKEYEKGHQPLFKSSPKFFSSIFFSDLQLQWDPVAQAFRNAGKLGISHMGDVDINANMNGYFEIRKNPRGSDEINIFLEVTDSEWYYFGYKNGQLGLSSSNFEINQSLANAEKAKGNDVVAAEMDEALKFRKRFLISYLGAKEEDFAKPAISSSPATLKKVPTPQAEKPNTPAKKTTTEEETGF